MKQLAMTMVLNAFTLVKRNYHIFLLLYRLELVYDVILSHFNIFVVQGNCGWLQSQNEDFTGNYYGKDCSF